MMTAGQPCAGTKPQAARLTPAPNGPGLVLHVTSCGQADGEASAITVARRAIRHPRPGRHAR